jgi:hypothetical protein
MESVEILITANNLWIDLKKIISLLFVAYLGISCSNNNSEQESAKRTILIYMAADNNLYRQEIFLFSIVRGFYVKTSYGAEQRKF